MLLFSIIASVVLIAITVKRVVDREMAIEGDDLHCVACAKFLHRCECEEGPSYRVSY